MRRNGEDGADLTPAGEDYLMKIHELSDGGREPVRIRDLSVALRVSPSSASRMATAMSADGFVNFRRYGYITLTDRGREEGGYMRKRRALTTAYLARLRGEDERAVASEAERLAHSLSPETVAAMESSLRG